MSEIRYETIDDAGEIDVAEVMAFYRRQGHRAPSSPGRLREMLRGSCCVVTARDGERLVGFARGVTDGVNGQLAECKLDQAFQGPGAVTRTAGRIEHDTSGIAREMASRVIDGMRARGVEMIHVLAYGTEVDFCEEMGFKRVGGMVALQMEVESRVRETAPVG